MRRKRREAGFMKANRKYKRKGDARSFVEGRGKRVKMCFPGEEQGGEGTGSSWEGLGVGGKFGSLMQKRRPVCEGRKWGGRDSEPVDVVAALLGADVGATLVALVRVELEGHVSVGEGGRVERS